MNMVVEEVKYLFQPITIGDVEISNRIMMAPMNTRFGYDGYVKDQLVDYYVERAKGGAGFICVEMGIVDYPIGSTAGKGMIATDDDKYNPGLKQLATAIDKNGSVPFIELSHGGRYAHSGLTGMQPVAPSPLRGFQGRGELPRELTTEEVEELVERFGDSAVRCSEAEFKGVLLMGSTGYLISQFGSPLTNKRTDRFGGKTPAERATFIVEIIKNIRKKLGNQFPVIYKISAEEYMDGGTVLEDSQIMAKRAEQAGASVIHTWAGWHESPKPMLPMSVPRGAFVYLAEAMKKIIDVPIMTGGRINDPRFASEIIRDGRADLVHFGRPFLTDPYFPKKAMKGDFDDINMCIACCRCFDAMTTRGPVVCSVNAELGKEGDKFSNVEKSKKILVIGGGPAGMEAARILTLRGHQVTLWEKNDKLGGNLITASLAPHKEETNCLTNYLAYQMKKLKVNIQLNKEATLDSISKENADEIIVATGAKAIIPDIPGIDSKNVVMALDVLKGTASTGNNVVIVGGGMIGCETAESLISKGKEVSIIEMLPKIARDVGPATRWSVTMRIARWGIKQYTSSKVIRILNDGVEIEREGNSEIVEADTVVIAAGMEPVNSLFNELKEKVSNVHAIGDCSQARRMLNAIHEGYEIGRRL
jgi:2,4-dienoyl-CoA reductase-like NADH-dependent reductase (Old Yellow Enzyme family)/thioredoxin reductase